MNQAKHLVVRQLYSSLELVTGFYLFYFVLGWFTMETGIDGLDCLSAAISNNFLDNFCFQSNQRANEWYYWQRTSAAGNCCLCLFNLYLFYSENSNFSLI